LRVYLARSLHLLDVCFGPTADSFNQIAQGPSQGGERVLYLWRNAGIDPARHDSVSLQAAQYVGQDFLRYPVYRSPQLSEPQCTVGEAPNDQHCPFVRNEIEDLAGWTVAVENIPKRSGFQKVTIAHKGAYLFLYPNNLKILLGEIQMQNVLITGATGVLGRAIVESAIDAGLAVRQGVRNPAKANPTAKVVHFDYADLSTITTALAGVSALVLMAPPLDANAPALLGPVVTAAKAAGVQQIVLISAFGVNHNEQAPMRIVEHLVIDSGVPYTILRPNFFMENFSEGPQSTGIREQNAIYLAAGDGKTSFVSVKDIATVAVAALKQSLTGVEVDLTGPEALDHFEVAKIISKVSGRTVVYHSLTEEQMLEGARSHGTPEPAVAYLAMLYGVVRAGYAAGITPYPETVTGKKPLSFESFAEQVDWK
jgi:uncharacterized protein YbjT (DUF2867 family)